MLPTNSLFAALKVVELASVLAGPAVGQFFAELGAQVIKIENATTGGDVTRSWKIAGEDPTKADSAYYRSVNYGKEIRMLDLTQSTAQAAVLALVMEADILITNFSPAAAEKLGMDIAKLAALNPRLIIAQLYAFGEEDPRPAYDIVLQAEAGFLGMTGTTTGQLARMPVALIDLLAAHQLKEGILVALIHRSSSGRGAVVKTNLYQSAIASLANQATNFLIAGAMAQPMGTAHPNIAPYGDLFTLAGGERIVLAIGNDRQFEALCAILHLSIPPSLTTNALRVRNRNELLQFLTEPLQSCALEQLLPPRAERQPANAYTTEVSTTEKMQQKIPFGQVKNMREVFDDALAQAQLLTYPDGQQAVRTIAFSLEAL